MTVTTIDPATGQPLTTYEETTPSELDALLERARAAARGWRRTSPPQRAEGLRRLATALRQRQGDLALLATLEMGKPLAESRAEVEKCARTCDWYADHAPALLEPETVVTEALAAHVLPQPLGVLLAIMPWNFPYWQVVRALAPALAAGNVVVLKHAPSTTGCALALADVAGAAGLPERGALRGGGECGTYRRRHRPRHQRTTGWRPLPLPVRRVPAGRSPPWPGGHSRRPCSSSEAVTPSSCSLMRTSTQPRRGGPAVGSRTPGSPASPPSGSSWRSRSPTPSPRS